MNNTAPNLSFSHMGLNVRDLARMERYDLDKCATPCATTVAAQFGDALASVYIGQISHSTQPTGENSDVQLQQRRLRHPGRRRSVTPLSNSGESVRGIQNE